MPMPCSNSLTSTIRLTLYRFSPRTWHMQNSTNSLPNPASPARCGSCALSDKSALRGVSPLCLPHANRDSATSASYLSRHDSAIPAPARFLLYPAQTTPACSAPYPCASTYDFQKVPPPPTTSMPRPHRHFLPAFSH